MANFLPRLDPGSSEFLNLRQILLWQPCPHCRRSGTLKSHGFLRGSGNTLRGIRLYCSNRYSNRGCGRTFPVHFEGRIPHASLDLRQAAKIIGDSFRPDRCIRGIAADTCSMSTAYRWIKRFKLSQSLIRSRLHLITGPDKWTTGACTSKTWQHLQKAFQGASCVLTAFQSAFQLSPLIRTGSKRPICHRRLPGWLDRYWAATRNGNPMPIPPPGPRLSTINPCWNAVKSSGFWQNGGRHCWEAT